jgi:hypothetical protein
LLVKEACDEFIRQGCDLTSSRHQETTCANPSPFTLPDMPYFALKQGL